MLGIEFEQRPAGEHPSANCPANSGGKPAVLGILGGMGPLASAEFLRTIYECNAAEFEQDRPACILLSNPRFPDRTDAILRGAAEEVLSPLAESLRSLLGQGATRLVVCCITLHHFLPLLPAFRREGAFLARPRCGRVGGHAGAGVDAFHEGNIPRPDLRVPSVLDVRCVAGRLSGLRGPAVDSRRDLSNQAHRLYGLAGEFDDLASGSVSRHLVRRRLHGTALVGQKLAPPG